MYSVESTFTAGSKPPVTRSFSGLDKGHIIDRIEKNLIQVLKQLNDVGSDAHNKKAALPNTNPATVVYNLSIFKDGQPWSVSTFEWHGMGDEAQAATLNLLDGAFRSLPKDVAAKEVKKHKTP